MPLARQTGRRRQAQGLSLWKAARKATETGNRAANILTNRKKGYYFLASDIASELKKIRRG